MLKDINLFIVKLELTSAAKNRISFIYLDFVYVAICLQEVSKPFTDFLMKVFIYTVFLGVCVCFIFSHRKHKILPYWSTEHRNVNK